MYRQLSYSPLPRRACTGEKPIKLCHRGIGGVIRLRVCCHFFNSKADVDYLMEAQKKVLKKQ